MVLLVYHSDHWKPVIRVGFEPTTYYLQDGSSTNWAIWSVGNWEIADGNTGEGSNHVQSYWAIMSYYLSELTYILLEIKVDCYGKAKKYPFI